MSTPAVTAAILASDRISAPAALLQYLCPPRAQEVQKGESEAQTPPPPPRFPESWGPEPEVQTEDPRQLTA